MSKILYCRIVIILQICFYIYTFYRLHLTTFTTPVHPQISVHCMLTETTSIVEVFPLKLIKSFLHVSNFSKWKSKQE